MQHLAAQVGRASCRVPRVSGGGNRVLLRRQPAGADPVPICRRRHPEPAVRAAARAPARNDQSTLPLHLHEPAHIRVPAEQSPSRHAAAGACPRLQPPEPRRGSVARRFPHLEWVLRPNCWVVVDRRFRQGSKFSYWYFSDNERLHIDMLSVGRFAHSNILGQVFYENLSSAERYDPDEASYAAFLKTPVIDAALDAITDLVGDRSCDLVPIGARYGRHSVA